jgi:hypothetical protein
MNSRTHTILQAKRQLASILFIAFVVLGAATVSKAAGLPDAPSAVAAMEPVTAEPAVSVSAPKFETRNPVDAKFLALSIISAGSTFSDSYTTLFARQNWLAHRQGVCNVETQSPYLYGTHPTVGRAYAVASVKSAGSIVAAYYLRKHHNRFWSAPLIANSLMSLEGVTQNMIACN